MRLHAFLMDKGSSVRFCALLAVSMLRVASLMTISVFIVGQGYQTCGGGAVLAPHGPEAQAPVGVRPNALLKPLKL